MSSLIPPLCHITKELNSAVFILVTYKTLRTGTVTRLVFVSDFSCFSKRIPQDEINHIELLTAAGLFLEM